MTDNTKYCFTFTQIALEMNIRTKQSQNFEKAIFDVKLCRRPEEGWSAIGLPTQETYREVLCSRPTPVPGHFVSPTTTGPLYGTMGFALTA